MEYAVVIRKLRKKQLTLAEHILLQVQVGTPEMAKAIHKYRAMAEVIDEVEKAQDDDDEVRNAL